MSRVESDGKTEKRTQRAESKQNRKGENGMSIQAKRIVIILVIIAVAFVLGRLAVRFVMNMMLGGTMFGGNFL